MKKFVAVVVPLLVLSGLVGPGTSPASATELFGGRFVSEEQFVDQTFQDFLYRPADQAGLDYWAGRMRGGIPPAQLIEALMASPEFAGETAPVVRLYRSIFNRQPDLGGLRFWVGKLRAGDSLTRMAAQMLAAGEFRELTEAQTTQEVIAAVYERSLGRTPDASGLRFWIDEIESGRRTLANFVVAVSESPEHQQLRSSDVATTLIFLGLLQRTPDSEGLAFWSSQLSAGRSIGSVVGDFLTTSEYLARFPQAPTVQTAIVASGLAIPWDIETLPDGTVIFTERSGALKVIVGGEARSLTADFRGSFVQGETGVMGLAVDPNFASNRRVYTCGGNASPKDVRVVVWTLDTALTTATLVGPLVTGLPLTSGRHGGCQLEFGTDGLLFVGTGDAATGTVPQNLASLGGKVLRVDAATGAGAADNPFARSANPDTRRIFTYGHRNVQGLAARPETSEMWSVEHGPTVNDEVNRLRSGGNAGWNPVPGYNESVSMTDLSLPDAMPAAFSTGSSTLALSGGDFFDHPSWGSWNGGLAVAALKNETLRLLYFNSNGLYLGQRTIIDGQFGRLRAVHQASGGSVYVSTSRGGPGGDDILHLTPG